MLLKLTISIVAFAALADVANYRRVTCRVGVNTATNEACCVFFALPDNLQEDLFENHLSLTGKFAGGADGSILLFGDIEIAFSENAGTDDGVDALAPFPTRHLVAAGDLIQFAAAVGLSNCPETRRLQFLIGRPNASAPAQIGAIRGPADSVSSILFRFADAGFTTPEVVDLFASHSIARSNTIIPGHQVVPFDGTSFSFDTQFFLEMLLKGIGVLSGCEKPNITGEVESPPAARARCACNPTLLWNATIALPANGKAWLTTKAS